MGGWFNRARWALLLVAGLPLGCVCGGQTGECFGSSDGSSGPGPVCQNAVPIAYEELSSLGYTPADVLSALGGTRSAILTSVQPGFWEALGMAPPETDPTDVLFSIDYAGGPITVDECQRVIRANVRVTLEIADGRLARSGHAMLVGHATAGTLRIDFWPPTEGDASTSQMTLDVSLSPTAASGALFAGPGALGTQRPTAAVDGE